MVVIRPLQLIFDEDPTIGTDVFAKNVGAERTDRALLRFQLQIDPKGIAEDVEVLLAGKPGREVRRFG
jgi:hypothetical protein